MKHDEVSAYLRVSSSKKFTDEMLGKATSIIKKWMNSKAIQTNMDNIIMEIAFELTWCLVQVGMGSFILMIIASTLIMASKRLRLNSKNFFMKFFKPTLTGDVSVI